MIRIILSTSKLQTTTNLLILSLTISDIATTIFNIPFMCARTMLTNWPFFNFLCFLMPTVQVSSVYVSTYTMAAIGIHRYRSVHTNRVKVHRNGQSTTVIKPYVMSKSKIGVWIIFIWAISIMFALPHSIWNKVSVSLVNISPTSVCTLSLDISPHRQRF